MAIKSKVLSLYERKTHYKSVYQQLAYLPTKFQSNAFMFCCVKTENSANAVEGTIETQWGSELKSKVPKFLYQEIDNILHDVILNSTLRNRKLSSETRKYFRK